MSILSTTNPLPRLPRARSSRSLTSAVARPRLPSISLENGESALAQLLLASKQPDAGGERRERIAKIMAEDGDELLAQQCRLAVRIAFGFRLIARFDEVPLVNSTVDRPEQGQARETMAPVRFALLSGIGDRRHLFATGREQVESDFVRRGPAS